MRRATLILIACILSASCATRHGGDLRSQMLDACVREDPDFPDGRSMKLIEFAYTGDVRTESGILHVNFVRAVITGMLAPRGENWLSFHGPDTRFVGEQPINPSYPPLRCEGSLIIFDGVQTNGEDRGNALQLSKGFLLSRYVQVGDH